ncbi:TetR/AcrR family transcriptional regulator [Bacteroidota bacterium]
MKKSQEAKQRILDASIKLFGQRGFSAVGVREIAKEANVNISMISYYYEGKVGILKEIIILYFATMGKIMESRISGDLSLDEFINRIFPALIDMMKKNTDLCRIALLEMPYEHPEIEEFKASILMNMLTVLKEKVWSKIGIDAPPEKFMPIIGPAIIMMTFSNFMIGDIATKAFNIEFDDKFYERYKNILTTIFLNGVHGLIEEVNDKKGDII